MHMVNNGDVCCGELNFTTENFCVHMFENLADENRVPGYWTTKFTVDFLHFNINLL